MSAQGWSTANYLTLPPVVSSDTWTISMFIKVVQGGAQVACNLAMSSNTRAAYMGVNVETTMRGRGGETNGTNAATNALNPLTVGAWASVIMRHNGQGSMDVFANGDVENKTSTAGQNLPYTEYDDWVTIGIQRYNTYKGVPLLGPGAEFAFWNEALTDSQIREIASGVNPLDVGNVVQYVPLVSDTLAAAGADPTQLGSLTFLPEDHPDILPPGGAAAGEFVTLINPGTGDGYIAATAALVTGDQLNYDHETAEGAYPVLVSADASFEIRGNPPHGIYTFGVRAFDNSDDTWGNWATQTANIAYVADPPLLVSPIPNMTFVNGTVYSVDLSVNFSKAVSYSATGLPAGLTVSSAGLLSGTYSGGGTTGATTVTATNADGSVADTFDWTGYATAPETVGRGRTNISMAITV